MHQDLKQGEIAMKNCCYKNEDCLIYPVMKCAICLSIIKKNPNFTIKELFPRGQIEDAITTVIGTAYCKIHLPELI